jgi:hypothetical protein
MSTKTYAVIDANTGIVIRQSVTGISSEDVLKRYLAKEWVQKLIGVNIEVMTAEEFKKSIYY